MQSKQVAENLTLLSALLLSVFVCFVRPWTDQDILYYKIHMQFETSNVMSVPQHVLLKCDARKPVYMSIAKIQARSRPRIHLLGAVYALCICVWVCVCEQINIPGREMSMGNFSHVVVKVILSVVSLMVAPCKGPFDHPHACVCVCG